jgi:hypothetical protein
LVKGDAFDALVRRLENRLRSSWVRGMRDARSANRSATLASRVGQNDVAALLVDLEPALRTFAAEVSAGYVHAGARAARRIQETAGRAFALDQSDPDAVRWMRDTASRVVRPVVEEQQAVARRVFQHGTARGLSPARIAEDVRASIGLTVAQVDQVERYRVLLERGDFRNALRYRLSDGRSDAALRRALSDGRLLGTERVDAMVRRYRDNWLRHRADTLALELATAATAAGELEAYAQAFDADVIDEADVTKEWVDRGDDRVRNSHRHVAGPIPVWQDFLVGGHRARYPGDPRLPASERAGCRCRMVVSDGAGPAERQRLRRIVRAARSTDPRGAT